MFDGKTNNSDGFFQSSNLISEISCCDNLLCMKRNVALEIGPMTSLLRLLDNDVIYSTPKFYNYTKIYTSNLWRHHYELNHTAESLEMDEEQCHRPSKRWNMRPPTRVKSERGLQVG